MNTERTPLCKHTDTQGLHVLIDAETGVPCGQANAGLGLLITRPGGKQEMDFFLVPPVGAN